MNLVPDRLFYDVDIILKGVAIFQKVFYFLTGMHYRGVVFAAEFDANLRKGRGGQLFTQIHGYLTGIGQGFGAAGGHEIGYADLIEIGNGTLDRLYRIDGSPVLNNIP